MECRNFDPPRDSASSFIPSVKVCVSPETIEYVRINPFGSLRRANNPGSRFDPFPDLENVNEEMWGV